MVAEGLGPLLMRYLARRRPSCQIVMCCKGDETYVIAYDHEQEREAVRTLGRWAFDPHLTMNNDDAGGLMWEVKRRAAAARKEKASK